MTKFGHYGIAALLSLGVAVVMLVLHMAVPFAMEDYSKQLNDAGQDDEARSAAEVQEAYDSVQDLYGLASPGMITTGLWLAIISAAFLVIMGLAPMGVNGARAGGWIFGVVGAMGSFFAVSTSFYWMGNGFATLMGVISGNPHDATRIWIISPVITAALGIFLMLTFVRIVTGVIATRDNLRTHATRQTRATLWSVVLLFAVLVMPWSIHSIDGDDRRAPNGPCPTTGQCDAFNNFYTAWGTSSDAAVAGVGGAGFGGILRIAEETKEQTGQEWFQGLALTIKVITAAAWIAFFAALTATLGGLVSSMTGTDNAARYIPMIQFLNVVMLPWAAIMFLLASSYMWQPNWDKDVIPKSEKWFTAGFSAVAVVPFTFLMLQQWTAAKALFADLRSQSEGRAAVSFD